MGFAHKTPPHLPIATRKPKAPIILFEPNLGTE